MRYRLEKNQEKVNDIICNPEFVEWYASQHGYTYYPIEDPDPLPEPSEPKPPSATDSVMDKLATAYKEGVDEA